MSKNFIDINNSLVSALGGGGGVGIGLQSADLQLLSTVNGSATDHMNLLNLKIPKHASGGPTLALKSPLTAPGVRAGIKSSTDTDYRNWMGGGGGGGGMPPTGRSIVKQNSHLSDGGMDFLNCRSSADYSGQEVHRFGAAAGNSMDGQANHHFRSNGESYGQSDFGGEFSTSRDIFAQAARSATNAAAAAAAANAFPPIGTFTLESVSQGYGMTEASGSSGPTSTGGIGIFNTGSNSGPMMNGCSAPPQTYGNNNGGDVNQGIRETGIIEKLLHSYGFIQCCERQARLFFHFSQFSGNIEHLKIGDPVEFEMTYDRRTGKPIASLVTKIAPEVVLSEERVTGTVTTEIKSDGVNASSNSSETTGRISYENSGECFFLPYTKDDVEGNVTLRSGDKVSFQIATNQRGNLGACHIRLENPVHPVKYRGVVCSMKESFGFIERADVVKEIFFHFSEADGTVELRPGDDVEFIIQTRNVSCLWHNSLAQGFDVFFCTVVPLQGKEVACNITRLPPGSVIFEDVGTQIYKGQVLKPLDRANPLRHNNDPLPGRIRYRAPDHSEVEVPFGDKDQKGDFTLRHGDWVQFLLATDRRDQLQRATSISLLDETFEVSGEKREQGVVAALKEGFGFLRCVERNTRLFFHFTEVLDTLREICVGDEVEFTMIQDPNSSFANTRQSAIRIKHLPEGSVQFETLIESNVEGVVTREAPKSPIKSQERTEGGVISYGATGSKKTIMYFLKDCDKPPRIGDHVRFNICQVKRNKELIAVNIKEILPNSMNALVGGSSGRISINTSMQQSILGNGCQMNMLGEQKLSPNSAAKNNNNGNGVKPVIFYGFIAVLKENFGFIETLDHDEEVFFHFSNFYGNTNNLELGQEVEYSLSTRGSTPSGGNCLPAENVKIVAKGTINQPKVLDAVYNGLVARPLRCINPDQAEYCGLITLISDMGEVVSTHEFGITSLVNKRDLLQKNDAVSFKLDTKGRAAEVIAVRQKKRANVDSIKGQFGFLDFEVEEGKKLFFHMSEVQGNSNSLHQGDTVEFSIVTNQRNGKSSACNVVKVIDNTQARPERLLSRLKINSVDESVPRLMVIRPPKGPDGTKGFALHHRNPRIAGIFVE
ncbi:LOW QUALITY PROTEIN: cold shock domain-containing protein E1-like [Phlebotomus argentipes]|uniref:LOW QUALITY PROTEIN: cold shock domain-containing protein E1-like n=1 Tax=Phlebotomus argentipes TaxID=94469 RepID=UPI00289326E3|nr:LOW QUALITY PROTEIN: cold shock domain-containing protein E1-like [Phlebotomus argentipes]